MNIRRFQETNPAPHACRQNCFGRETPAGAGHHHQRGVPSLVSDPDTVPAEAAQVRRDTGDPTQEGGHRLCSSHRQAGGLLHGCRQQDNLQNAGPGEGSYISTGWALFVYIFDLKGREWKFPSNVTPPPLLSGGGPCGGDVRWQAEAPEPEAGGLLRARGGRVPRRPGEIPGEASEGGRAEVHMNSLSISNNKLS